MRNFGRIWAYFGALTGQDQLLLGHGGARGGEEIQVQESDLGGIWGILEGPKRILGTLEGSRCPLTPLSTQLINGLGLING